LTSVLCNCKNGVVRCNPKFIEALAIICARFAGSGRCRRPALAWPPGRRRSRRCRLADAAAGANSFVGKTLTGKLDRALTIPKWGRGAPAPCGIDSIEGRHGPKISYSFKGKRLRAEGTGSITAQPDRVGRWRGGSQ